MYEYGGFVGAGSLGTRWLSVVSASTGCTDSAASVPDRTVEATRVRAAFAHAGGGTFGGASMTGVVERVTAPLEGAMAGLVLDDCCRAALWGKKTGYALETSRLRDQNSRDNG